LANHISSAIPESFWLSSCTLWGRENEMPISSLGKEAKHRPDLKRRKKQAHSVR